MAERYGALPPDTAQLSPQEIQRLLKGAELRQEKQERASKRGSSPSRDQRRRENAALEKYE